MVPYARPGSITPDVQMDNRDEAYSQLRRIRQQQPAHSQSERQVRVEEWDKKGRQSIARQFEGFLDYVANHPGDEIRLRRLAISEPRQEL